MDAYRAGGRVGAGRAGGVAIKDSAESWVRGKPVLAMVVVALIGVVVGGLIGLGVGYKIEKSRTQDDVKRLQQQIKSKGSSNPNGPIGQRVGEVSGSSAGSLSLKTKLQGAQQITTTATTPYEKTAAAKASDIAVGRRVLVATGGREVIVLPAASKLGRVVANVGKDTFAITNKDGRQVKVKLANVQKVYTLTPAKATDAKVGADVLVGGRSAGNGFAATEIIVLPVNSTFTA
jgi:hypothetical protein